MLTAPRLRGPPRTPSSKLLAVITLQEVIRRSREHVKGPTEPVANDDGPALHFEVTGENVPCWAVGVDPDSDERGPPVDYEVVDPPAPDI